MPLQSVRPGPTPRRCGRSSRPRPATRTSTTPAPRSAWRAPCAARSTRPSNAALGDTQVEGVGDWLEANIGAAPLNLALAGTAEQSTTLTTYAAGRAIDGLLGNFTHTAPTDPASWWQVDLGQAQTIEDIVVVNRQDACCKSRLRDITVQVLADNGTTVLYESPLLNPENALGGGVLGAGPASLEIDLVGELGGPVYGRYVKVLRTPDPDGSGVGADPAAGAGEPAVLSLAEVQVFGAIGVPEPGSLVLVVFGLMAFIPVVGRRGR